MEGGQERRGEFDQSTLYNWTSWHITISLVPGKQNQVDVCEFKVSLVYTASSRLCSLRPACANYINIWVWRGVSVGNSTQPAFVENPSLVHSAHVRLTAVRNSSSRGSNFPFWTLCEIACVYTQGDIHVYTQFKNNKTKSLQNKGFSGFGNKINLQLSEKIFCAKLTVIIYCWGPR